MGQSLSFNKAFRARKIYYIYIHLIFLYIFQQEEWGK